jgi:hypothetical protein
MTSTKTLRITLLLIATASCLSAVGNCSTSEDKGFAIYLTQDNVPPSQIGELSSVKLAAQPVISINDIIRYYSQTHVLKLTDSAYKRVSDLKIPTSGKSFIVCVDKKPIYGGAFWTSASSQSFDGVTITNPFILESGMIALDSGYPSSSSHKEPDPRNNPEILQSLNHAGKLITTLDLTTILRVPPSMKGYELYSWLQNGQWHFSIITGTNRSKTLEEIISPENSISETGFVKISVTGVDAIKDIFDRIPVGTSINWVDHIQKPSEQTGIVIQLPPQQVSDVVRDYALHDRMDFHIMVH